MIYGSGIAQALARRGISTLMVDQPGVGEALRLQQLPAIVESEVWAGAVVDWLQARGEIQPELIGTCAWSLGGYYAPRAAAFEKRLKLCVAWGANYNWGELQKRRLAREGDRPVPHYWEHVQWVWGKDTLEEFMAFAPRVTLEGVMEKITVPILITHGANDRQIPLEYAHKQYETAINSPKRELKIFTAREGGIEHASADNMTNARDYIADWVAETFREAGTVGVRT
jgi:alpha-beta hydrolase superfamily lysophospholipase